jgi:hypothetical protein
VQTLSAARILNLRAQNDENLALIERGRGEQYVADYTVTATRIAGADGTGGLIAFVGDAARSSDPVGVDAGLGDRFASVMSTHRAVRREDDHGNYEAAVQLAIKDEASAVQGLDAALRGEIERAHAEFDRQASAARAGFDELLIGIPLLTAAAAGLVLFGIQRRIAEYR